MHSLLGTAGQLLDQCIVDEQFAPRPDVNDLIVCWAPLLRLAKKVDARSSDTDCRRSANPVTSGEFVLCS